MFQFCGGIETGVPIANSHIMMLGWNETLPTFLGGDRSQPSMIFAPYWFEFYWNGFPVNFSHGMVTLFALEWDWQDCSRGCDKNNIMATRHSELVELVVSSNWHWWTSPRGVHQEIQREKVNVNSIFTRGRSLHLASHLSHKYSTSNIVFNQPIQLFLLLLHLLCRQISVKRSENSKSSFRSSGVGENVEVVHLVLSKKGKMKIFVSSFLQVPWS